MHSFEVNNIQLMHSFEVNIRICQPENSDAPIVFIFINLPKSDVPCALSPGRLFQQSTSQISATLTR